MSSAPVPSFAITPAAIADLPRVRALAFAIWPATYNPILGAERVGPMLEEIYALETLAADIGERGHRYWIARNDGGDLGFASAYREEGRVWIKKLYVLDTARGMGLGKALITAARAALGEALPVALYVNNGNEKAIAFYRAQGFVVEKSVPVRMGPFDFTDHIMLKR